MSQLLEQTRRATQKMLQTVGIAKESSDDEEFTAAIQDYNVLTATVKEVGSDIRSIQAGLERLVNSTTSLAEHIRAAEGLLSRHLAAIAGAGSPACKLLESVSIQLGDAQREITAGSLSKVLALINNSVVPQLLKECKDDPLTANALEKRKRAHLDYDAKLRSHSATPSQVEEARRAFAQLSGTATAILGEKAKVRTAAIVGAASSVAKALKDHYDLSAAAMASTAEVSLLLGSFVNAPGCTPASVSSQQKQQQQQQQKPRQKPQQQQQQQQQQLKQTQVKPAQAQGQATFFDMLDAENGVTSTATSTSSTTTTASKTPSSSPAPPQATFFDMLGSGSGGSSGSTSPQPQQATTPTTTATPQNTLDIFAQTPSSPSSNTQRGSSANDLLSGWDSTSGGGGNSSGGSSDTLADLMGTTSNSSGAQQGDILMPSSAGPSSYGAATAAGSMFADLGIDLQSPSTSPSFATTAQQLPPDETAVLASKEDVDRWANEGGRKANIRALLSTMETVLWEGSGWKKVTLAELVDPASVKNCYKKAITIVHPDKVVGARRQELARYIFAALRQSHDAFRRELEAQEAARARAQAMAMRARGGNSSSTGGDDVD